MKEKKMKTRKQYPENFKSLMGFCLPMFTYAYSTVIFALFMQYLTDYAGIDNAIGKVGYAAGFATIFMIATRIVDAVDDPLQAFFVDNAREIRFGKYRKFTLIGIILIWFGMIAMFNVPKAVMSNPLLLPIWCFVSYLFYDMGTALDGIMAIVRKATDETVLRAKLMTWIRMTTIIAAVPASLFIPIATAFNSRIGDMGKAVSITVIVMVSISSIISLIGVKFLSEPYQPIDTDDSDQEKDNGKKGNSNKINGKELLGLLRLDKAMWVHDLAFVTANMGIGFAGLLVYFLKWYFFADASTGVVNNAGYAAMYSVNTILSLVGTFTAPLFARPIIKKVGSVDKTARILWMIGGIMYVLLFGAYLTGLLKVSAIVYIFLNFLAGLPNSIAMVPVLLLNIEVADFAEYKTGKNMTQICQSIYNIFVKGSGALSTAIMGGLLVLFHYSVDSATGSFAGDLSQIPGMIRGFAVFMTLMPGIFQIAASLLYRFLYPITPEVREEMHAELERRHGSAKTQNG